MPYPTREQLLEIIAQVKISHGWMLKSIRWTEDQNDSNYSPELKHAVEVNKMLDML